MPTGFVSTVETMITDYITFGDKAASASCVCIFIVVNTAWRIETGPAAGRGLALSRQIYIQDIRYDTHKNTITVLSTKVNQFLTSIFVIVVSGDELTLNLRKLNMPLKFAGTGSDSLPSKVNVMMSTHVVSSVT